MAESVPRPRHDPLRLAVLISGGGTTMASLARQIQLGELHASIATVIGSREQAAGLNVAKDEFDLPTFVVPRKAYDSAAAFSEHVFGLARDAEADLVCLAGFLSLLVIPDDFAWRVINVHPALLPAFGGDGMYGKRVHQAVLDAGCKVTGCTVHFCDQHYDTGPIIEQRACRVADDDTVDSLAARVAEQERAAYPEAIRLIGEHPLEIEGKRTRIAPGR
jgi:formyltetrahydrofolate-dependent phosphoribosylglycinamide formyltransferase